MTKKEKGIQIFGFKVLVIGVLTIVLIFLFGEIISKTLDRIAISAGVDDLLLPIVLSGLIIGSIMMFCTLRGENWKFIVGKGNKIIQLHKRKKKRR